LIATVALVQLVGYVVLLLWGMHMVQTGVVRAFGSNLRRMIGRTLRNRFAAIGAGLVVTMLLQSSTATAMMTTSLAAEGMLALSPALAVMLGANIGTALIVKALSFDVSWVAPLLLIAGYVAFWRGRRGIAHDLGRVGIGLGLMLLALHQLVATIEPVQTAPVLGALLGALTREPLLDLAFAALLTWAAHSSVAVMLLLASLAGANVITPVAAIALVLGANLGGTIPPRQRPRTRAADACRSATSPSVPWAALSCCRSPIRSRRRSGGSRRTRPPTSSTSTSRSMSRWPWFSSDCSTPPPGCSRARCRTSKAAARLPSSRSISTRPCWTRPIWR
jgi:Na/Pi-cotransporter